MIPTIEKEDIKILLVEDIIADQELFKAVLEETCYSERSLIICKRLSEAVSCVKETNPDIVILDLGLPDSFGIQTFSRLYTAFPEIPIVVYTAMDDRQQALDTIRKGAEDYFVKGEIDSVQLEKTLRNAIARKQIRVHLLHTIDELKNSNRSLEEFAYLASHDLKAPITNLRSLLELMDDTFENKSLNSQILPKLKISVDQIDSTLSILVDLLKLKQNVAKREVVVDLQEELVHVLDKIKDLILDNNAEVRADFSVCGEVSCSSMQMQSILQNLITNSIKYRHPDRPPFVKISTKMEDVDLVILVEDNGVGIDLEKYSGKIFEPFNHISKNRDGLGVGLYIVKSLVEVNKGEIAVQSVINEGTTFKIKLPKAKR